MSSISLIRRKHVWWPTLTGWMLLCLVLLTASYVFWRHIYGFLAHNEPAPGASVLIVEGWMQPGELDQVVGIVRSGHYDHVVVAGGPLEDGWQEQREKSYAERAANYLRSHGLADAHVEAAPSPGSVLDRTYVMAIAVRDWIAQKGLQVKAVDLVSVGVHARRSHMVYRMALGNDMDVGIFAVRTGEFDDFHWWRSSGGAKAVMGESISVLWTECCFWPPERRFALPPGGTANRVSTAVAAKGN